MDALIEIVANLASLDASLDAFFGGTGAGIAAASVWLAVAFALGLVHAFDADHVMALSVLATGERSGRRGVRAGLRWSLGHGMVVLAAGLILFSLGLSLPSAFSAAAERLVGLVMIGLGLHVWLDLWRRRAHVHFHRHDGLPAHAHWHSHADSPSHPQADRHHHEHAASMVGALHGLAGSAPILALLPAAARSPLLGLAYLVLFGLGVALAMAIVSGALGHFAAHLSGRAQGAALSALRAFSATGSIAVGIWLGLGA